MKTYTQTVLVYLTLLSAYSLYGDATIPEPYRSNSDLPLDMHGWFSRENKDMIGKLLARYQPKTVVELGSWLGVSTIFMAQHVPAESKVYAVDHWEGDQHTNANPEGKKRAGTLYQQFLSNVKHHNLTNSIIPLRMTTIEAALLFDDQSVDFLYIDASHDETSVTQDFVTWFPKVTTNGLICGDDWGCKAVRDGVIQGMKLCSIAPSRLKSIGNFWYLESIV